MRYSFAVWDYKEVVSGGRVCFCVEGGLSCQGTLLVEVLDTA
jgi:hypothetical protein